MVIVVLVKVVLVGVSGDAMISMGVMMILMKTLMKTSTVAVVVVVVVMVMGVVMAVVLLVVVDDGGGNCDNGHSVSTGDRDNENLGKMMVMITAGAITLKMILPR